MKNETFGSFAFFMRRFYGCWVLENCVSMLLFILNVDGVVSDFRLVFPFSDQILEQILSLKIVQNVKFICIC